MDFYRSLLDMDLPPELEAMEALYREDDLSIESEADQVKFEYVEGDNLVGELIEEIEQQQ